MKNLKGQLIKKWGIKNGLKMYRHIYRYGYHVKDVTELHQCRFTGESYDTMVVIMRDGVCLGLAF